MGSVIADYDAASATAPRADTDTAVATAWESDTAPRSGRPETISAPAPTPAAKPKVDRHLYQIDFVRLVTFAGVILDHVILGIAAPANVAAGGVGMLLRYTRYSFFALTGFVLTYQYRNRPLEPLSFWRRRYKLIGLPFLVWSLFYWAYERYEAGGVAALRTIVTSGHEAELAAKSIAYDLITGNAWYHLYFLSVSMQIYAIYPALLWILKRTWGFHRYLLTVSFVIQIAVMYTMVSGPHAWLQHGLLDVLNRHVVVTLIPYQFFVLAGCVAAMHFEAFSAFMRRWRFTIIGVTLAVIIGMLVDYAHSTSTGTDVPRASNAFLPHSAFTFLAIIGLLYVGGTIWQARRRPGSVADRMMKTGADRSFGIYLMHALALAELQSTIREHLRASSGVVITLAYLATVLLTILVVEVLRRSPISLVTTGRSMIDPSEQNVTRSTVVGVVAIAVGLAVRLGAGIQAGDLISGAGALLLVSMVVVTWRRRRSA